jgi:hypothetical protein
MINHLSKNYTTDLTTNHNNINKNDRLNSKINNLSTNINNIDHNEF